MSDKPATSSIFSSLRKPPWRTLVPACLLLVIAGLSYLLWSPGATVTDGRHDKNQNGIWLQHGWLGDDGWFEKYNKIDRIPEFRDKTHIRKLARQLRDKHITDVYPHVAPTDPDGHLPPIDHDQTVLFLNEFEGFRVIPWIGGAWGVQAFPEKEAWRQNFCTSIRELLDNYPEFAGIHINIEPCPSGNRDFITLLEEVHAQLKPDEILSVAAYPPPTRWHPYPEVHWEETYFNEVASHADQLVVMMYDTSLTNAKFYRSLMSAWTREVLEWSGNTDVLLGLPAYDDADVEYHDPAVENLRTGLSGIHDGLMKFDTLPDNYQGIAIYSEWEMQPEEWDILDELFLDSSKNNVPLNPVP